MILENLKKAHIEAMKNKDAVAKSLFSIILNEAQLLNIKKREGGEEFVDADAIRIIQKNIKELDGDMQNYQTVGNTEMVENIEKQISILKSYLPQMLSEQEILEIIATLEDKSVASVMKHFKANYDGKCDMKSVSTLARG